MEDAAAAHVTTTANAVPRLGKIARWYVHGLYAHVHC
jgi:hypothetical protein